LGRTCLEVDANVNGDGDGCSGGVGAGLFSTIVDTADRLIGTGVSQYRTQHTSQSDKRSLVATELGLVTTTAA